jgi:flagellar P-ring protein precursor FlgI
MAEVVNAEFGDAATVEDPGSIVLEPPTGTPAPVFLQEVTALTMEPDAAARIVIDARDGTVVASAGLTVGEAVVSHGTLTVAIGGTVEDDVPGSVRVPAGTSVQDVATALHAVAATPQAIAAIFRSLRQVGAIRAQLVVR